MTDPFNLSRFLSAQETVIGQVRAELLAGYKRSHWMWFIFPQLTGLGRSSTAQHYAITSLAEARSYVMHPILGQRLIECTILVNRIQGRSVNQIFGTPDDLKFHSSMTLFTMADPNERCFVDALSKYFDGTRDTLTNQKLLAASGE